MRYELRKQCDNVRLRRPDGGHGSFVEDVVLFLSTNDQATMVRSSDSPFETQGSCCVCCNNLATRMTYDCRRGDTPGAQKIHQSNLNDDAKWRLRAASLLDSTAYPSGAPRLPTTRQQETRVLRYKDPVTCGTVQYPEEILPLQAIVLLAQ